ncbi:MAG: alpha/beta hydrolase family esterase [Bacteriovoracaceae bacterium]
MRILLTILLILIASSAFARKSEMTINGRRFVVVSPNTRPTQKRPLLLLLHGCKQSPEIILEGTRLDEAAVAKNFYVIAPEQTVFENVDHCWNWFLTYEQARNPMNEMGQFIEGIKLMIEKAEVDPEQVYLAGISAGGVMGHNVASCYPDVFKGVALSAGLAYKIAEDLYEASTVLDEHHFKDPNYLGKAAYQCGSVAGKRRLVKMLLVHGENDQRVNPYHTKLISEVNEVTLDYYDDGKRNNSDKPVVSENVRNLREGYGVTITEKTYKTIKFSERTIMVKGMAHAWGGGKPISVNFDPKAPSTNEFIFQFFQL